MENDLIYVSTHIDRDQMRVLTLSVPFPGRNENVGTFKVGTLVPTVHRLLAYSEYFLHLDKQHASFTWNVHFSRHNVFLFYVLFPQTSQSSRQSCCKCNFFLQLRATFTTLSSADTYQTYCLV